MEGERGMEGIGGGNPLDLAVRNVRLDVCFFGKYTLRTYQLINSYPYRGTRGMDGNPLRVFILLGQSEINLH